MTKGYLRRCRDFLLNLAFILARGILAGVALALAAWLFAG